MLVPAPTVLPPDDVLELWAKVLARGHIDPDSGLFEPDEATWERNRRELAKRAQPAGEFPFPGAFASDPLFWLRRAYRETESVKAKLPLFERLVAEPSWQNYLHRAYVTGVAFSPDGRRRVSVGERAVREGKAAPVEVRLWDVPGGRPVAALEGVTGRVQSVAFRPDGNEFAVAATEIDAAAQQMTGVVTLHAASDGRVLRTVRLDPMTRVSDIDYRPGSRRLTVVVLPATKELGWGANLTPVVREYDPETDRWRDLIWTVPNGPMSVAYSPDGRRLATGNLDGSVKVWDATSGYPRSC